MTQSNKKTKTSSLAVPAHLTALLDPLGSLSSWTDMSAARNDLELLAHNAIGMRNHSLWWNYIYLHERYAERYAPDKRDILPGFPDMDTAVKVGAPDVYNWYYGHKQLPTVDRSNEGLVDLSLCLRAGFLSQEEACDVVKANLSIWRQSPPDVGREAAPPLWLIATWKETPAWGPLLDFFHNQPTFESAGIAALDRQVLDPMFLWQWSCLTQKDISFLPPEQATRSLDALRLSSMHESLRGRCEKHFLDYFPHCKPEADIAFALGGPLWVPPLDTLIGELAPDVFESAPEALHAK